MRLTGDTAKSFLEDVRAGVAEEILREKYNLSASEFLVAKATAKDLLRSRKSAGSEPARQINGRQFLNDLNSGMDDEALMTKYDLSQREIQSLFRQLIEAGLITAMKLANRLEITKSQVYEAFKQLGKIIDDTD